MFKGFGAAVNDKSLLHGTMAETALSQDSFSFL